MFFLYRNGIVAILSNRIFCFQSTFDALDGDEGRTFVTIVLLYIEDNGLLGYSSVLSGRNPFLGLVGDIDFAIRVAEVFQ